jgi:phage-related protein
MYKHIPIEGEIVIDLKKALNMQTLSDTILTSFPGKDKYRIDGIAIPIVNAECKGFGVIDPISDIRAAISRLYDELMRAIFKPIWDVLMKLLEFLGRFIDEVLDYRLPIFDLTIGDLFKPGLYDKIKARIEQLWYNAKAELEALLKSLGIPWPLFTNVESPQKIIEQIMNSIIRALWDLVTGMVLKIIGLIKAALDLYDRIVNKGTTILGELWELLKGSIFGKFINLILHPPTLQEIQDWILEYARAFYKKVAVTFDEIMAIIHDFEIPILKIKPFDWRLPLFNPQKPDLNFRQILNDIKVWIQNFVISIIKKFIEAAVEILRALIPDLDKLLSWTVITIPLTFCAVEILPLT